mgnify:CR=1 FL=1
MADLHARYKDSGPKRKYTAAEDRRHEALKKQLSLDKHAQAKPIDYEKWEKETIEHKKKQKQRAKEIAVQEARIKRR